MKFPNAVVIILLSALQILLQVNFPGEWWTPMITAAVLAISKTIEVNVPAAPIPQSDIGGPAPQQDSKLKRFLVG